MSDSINTQAIKNLNRLFIVTEAYSLNKRITSQAPHLLPECKGPPIGEKAYNTIRVTDRLHEARPRFGLEEWETIYPSVRNRLRKKTLPVILFLSI